MRKIIVLIVVAITNILLAQTASANECWRIEKQLQEAEYKLRQGGNASYMKMWQKSRDHNAEELPKCRKRSGGEEPQITLYTGASNAQAENRIVVSSDIKDPQLQQLIKTCNYWINEYNRNSSPENLAFRDNSCRDVKTASDRITNPQKPFVMIHRRSAKECIKPNNVIDNDVKLCMQGLKEPNWVTIKE